MPFSRQSFVLIVVVRVDKCPFVGFSLPTYFAVYGLAFLGRLRFKLLAVTSSNLVCKLC